METNIDFIKSCDGQRIALFSNLRSEPARGNIIIVPPFGKSAKDLFVFAFYLWHAGWNVFRFDARNHVGSSSGKIENFTLSSLLIDLQQVSATLEGRGFYNPALLGISLSVPVILKFAGNNPSVRSIVSVVGAIDVAFAIEQASGDVVAQYRENWLDKKTHQKLLGYDVLAEAFVTDMDNAGFAPLETVIADVRASPCPVHMLFADEDEWVERDSAMAVHGAAPDGSALTWFEGLTHEFGRSIRTAKLICLEVCRMCDLGAGRENEFTVPSFTEILRQSSAEASYLDAVSRAENVGDDRQPLIAS